MKGDKKMNGFTMMADTYRKSGGKRKAELYDFLAKCSDEDICDLFDSTAFNEIAKGYLRLAVRELVENGELNEEQGQAVRNEFSFLFSEKTAKDVVG